MSFLALFLLPCAAWSAPQVGADATYAKKIEAMLPPKVTCVVSSPMVVAGRSVTVTAQVQGAAAGLVYNFSSNAGKLYPDGSSARLDTVGVPAGSAVSVTCQVMNGLGKKGSGDVVVHVVAIPSVKTGGQGTIVESAEIAAKNGLGGSGGSPAGGRPHHASHEHPAQDAETQAARAQQAEADQGVVAPAPPPVAVAPAAQVPAAAAAAGAPSPTAAGSVDPYQGSEVRAQWVKALKNGKIEYLIPTQMKLHETSVVTVVVHGFADSSQNNLPEAKTGALKVSPYMRMQLTAEDNPDEFKIDPKDGAVLPVPIDSSAKWTWSVVPNQPAKDQKLTIEAFLVYSEAGDNPQELFPSYVATVSVSVPGFWESLREDFWNDPSAAIKYLLPGGAGFTVAASLIVWWWKRKHPSDDKPKKEE